MEFLNSSLFNALITLIVGCTAFILYYKKINDNKQTIAKIIWLEVKATEERIDDIKRNSLNNNTKPILRNNSWLENQHYIISEFDSDEIKILTDFYNTAENIESLRQQIINSHIETMNSKAAAVQNELMSMIKQDVDLNEIEKFSKNYNDIGHVFIPNEPVRLAKIELENIRYITGSTAGSKLKNISKIH